MSEIEKLVEVSREYGSDDKYVIAGGGNTSFKTADKHPFTGLFKLFRRSGEE